MNQTTRELWLKQAIETYWRHRFGEIGYSLPEKIHVSVGFGNEVKQESARIAGQCWSGLASADGVPHIFISPIVGDTAEVLATLGHELAHAALDSDQGIQDGHGKRFPVIMHALGFDGPMAYVNPGDELSFELFAIAAKLGEYPHGVLNPQLARTRVTAPSAEDKTPTRTKVRTGPGTQTSRHLKLTCKTDDCPCGGYRVSTSQRWIDIGWPLCPVGNLMTTDEER